MTVKLNKLKLWWVRGGLQIFSICGCDSYLYIIENTRVIEGQIFLVDKIVTENRGK